MSSFYLEQGPLDGETSGERVANVGVAGPHLPTAADRPLVVVRVDEHVHALRALGKGDGIRHRGNRLDTTDDATRLAILRTNDPLHDDHDYHLLLWREPFPTLFRDCITTFRTLQPLSFATRRPNRSQAVR